MTQLRAVIYARYSTNLQREASIEDQVRLCRSRIDTARWSLTDTYSDAAISGASRFRPGYRKLLEDTRRGAFDVVVAEPSTASRGTRRTSPASTRRSASTA
jgi:DNA invertase Pin-like site-specific DNA recombinase